LFGAKRADNPMPKKLALVARTHEHLALRAAFQVQGTQHLHAAKTLSRPGGLHRSIRRRQF